MPHNVRRDSILHVSKQENMTFLLILTQTCGASIKLDFIIELKGLTLT